jgi:hypothetical protein
MALGVVDHRSDPARLSATGQEFNRMIVGEVDQMISE